MIGIIGAMDIEINLINEKIENKQAKEINNVIYTSGTIGQNHVVTAVCGMGKVNAAICAQSMIFHYSPDIIINTGVAGGVSEELSICDIAIADSLYEHDLDITPLGYPLGYISGADITKIPADRKVVSVLLSCAERVITNKVITGVIVSGDQFINSAEKKAFLKEQFNACACEMEGAAIGHVCYMNNVAFAVIRAISDGAGDEAHMDFDTFSKKAAKNSSDLILEYLKN